MTHTKWQILDPTEQLTTVQTELHNLLKEIAAGKGGATPREMMQSLGIANPSVFYSRVEHLQGKGAISGYVGPNEQHIQVA